MDEPHLRYLGDCSLWNLSNRVIRRTNEASPIFGLLTL